MKDEVEEFLRRVAQLRAQAEAQARAQQQRPRLSAAAAGSAAAADDAAAGAAGSGAGGNRLPRASRGRGGRCRAGRAGRPRRPARRRSTCAGRQEIAEHTRHLGEEVDLADDKLEAHLHQTFDHQLGRLKKTASDTAAVAGTSSRPPDVTLARFARLLAHSGQHPRRDHHGRNPAPARWIAGKAVLSLVTCPLLSYTSRHCQISTRAGAFTMTVDQSRSRHDAPRLDRHRRDGAEHVRRT